MQKKQTDSGFILISVLLIVAGLIALSLAYLSIVRTGSQANATLRRQAEAQLVADGLARGVAFAISRSLAEQTTDLTTSNAEGPFRTDGSPLTCRLSDGEARIVVVDTAGLVDLNQAPLQLLERLLRGVGVDLPKSRALAGDIVDFRDGDDDSSIGSGSEGAGMTGPGKARFFKNQPFITVLELDAVPGMDRALVEKLRPLVTVHGHGHDIDPKTAPPALLMAFVRADGAMAQPTSVAELRRSYRPLLDFDSGGGPRAFVINVAVRGQSGVRAWRQAVAETSSIQPGAFQLREWTQVVPATDEEYHATAPASDCLEYLR